MIVMNLELDNIYGFNAFRINFSYPKKIVNSTIDHEHLKDCPQFRYKKAVILMGANATGKTTLGRALLRIFSFIGSGNPAYLTQMISEKDRPSRICIDFVNTDRVLHRMVVKSNPDNKTSTTPIFSVDFSSSYILKTDTYESAVKRLVPEKTDITTMNSLSGIIGPLQFSFALDNEENNHQTGAVKPELFLKVLKAVIGTLDPSLKDISVLEGVEDSYVIRRNEQEIILQKGKLTNQNLLSSGTIRGIDIAILMASIISNQNGFYYCDEHFSYIQTDLEKRMFGIMLENLQENEQLIFTTHNTDMLDLNLPKHTYAFLRKEKIDDHYSVSVMYASDVLKRNTDSIRCAAENDVFSSIPDESLLDSLSNSKI